MGSTGSDSNVGVSGIRCISRFKDPGVIYFARADGHDAIKIGFSRNLKQRIRQLECASGKTVTVILAVRGLPADEIALHRRFKHCRLDGEWFRPTDELTRHIDELRAKEAA